MRLCGVSLIFISAFFALVVFFSIFITAFFLPELPGAGAGSMDAGRVTVRTRSDNANSPSLAVVDLLEEEDDEEDGDDEAGGAPQNTSRVGGVKRAAIPVNEISVVWDFGAEYRDQSICAAWNDIDFYAT